jgi:hypothetical protein
MTRRTVTAERDFTPRAAKVDVAIFTKLCRGACGRIRHVSAFRQLPGCKRRATICRDCERANSPGDES